MRKDMYSEKVRDFIEQINKEINTVDKSIQDLEQDKKRIVKQLKFQRDKRLEWGKLKEDLEFLIREDR